MQTVSLSDLTALLANEPKSGKTRTITVARTASVRSILDGTTEAFLVDPADEKSRDGSDGKLNSIRSSYVTIVKSLKAEGKIAVTVLKSANRVAVHKIADATPATPAAAPSK